MDHGPLRRGAWGPLTSLALLPLDDRPVNYDQPWWLGRAAGIEVRRPPREWLGNPFRAADRERLAGWVLDEAPVADGLVVGVDMLAYGGLIPSRTSATPLTEVIAALEPLRAIRSARPELPILAFSVLMRVNRSDSAEEEKPYWADHGPDLFRLSYLDDKARAGDADADEVAESRALVESIPAAVVADYRAGRARNHAVNRLMLDWVSDGTIDYAVIAQDDTAPYGWNIEEARALRRLIVDRETADRAIVYPGADEVGSLLVAAFVCRRAGLQPRIWTRYSGIDGPSAVTAFEDRPFGELVKAHLGPLGGRLVATPDEADLVLAVNAPAEAQADAWLQLGVRDPAGIPSSLVTADPAALVAARKEMSTVRRDVDEAARAIAADLAVGRDVAVVDVAFTNGADLAFAERLAARAPLARLAAYSAWNTAGNSLGTALAQGIVRAISRRTEQPVEALAAHLALLAIHWLDDYAYQGVVRTKLLLEDLPALGLTPSFDRLPDERIAEIEERLHRHLASHVTALGQAFEQRGIQNGPSECRVLSVAVEPPKLPWQRLFELSISPSIELA
jgi:Protein of unknown function (DUF4127)